MKSTILFTGDLGLTAGCGNKHEVLSSSILEHFDSADAVCVNLELPFVDDDCKMAPYTHPSLSAYSKHAPILEALKPSVVNIGTNHCMDGGNKGIQKTIEVLNRMSACSIGAGINENEARQACLITRNGVKFGFLSFCKKGNFTSSGNKGGATLLSETNLREDIPRVKGACDFLIVTLHMGMEFSKSVHPIYRDLAHLAIDLGVSCVIGHHPHVIQGIETYKGAPIFYSLGNFLFDNYAGAVTYKGHWEARHRGILAKVLFSSLGVSYEVVPIIYTSKPLSVKIAEGDEAQNILSEIDTLSESISRGIDQNSAEAEAIGAIAKREIATIFVLTKIHGARFLWYFVKDLKVRHFRMVFRAIWERITGK